jgi:hypothetical protein
MRHCCDVGDESSEVSSLSEEMIVNKTGDTSLIGDAKSIRAELNLEDRPPLR